jgi:hypothetical protein
MAKALRIVSKGKSPRLVLTPDSPVATLADKVPLLVLLLSCFLFITYRVVQVMNYWKSQMNSGGTPTNAGKTAAAQQIDTTVQETNTSTPRNPNEECKDLNTKSTVSVGQEEIQPTSTTNSDQNEISYQNEISDQNTSELLETPVITQSISSTVADEVVTTNNIEIPNEQNLDKMEIDESTSVVM